MLLVALLIGQSAQAWAEPSEPDTFETAGVFTLGEVVVTAQGEIAQGAVDTVEEVLEINEYFPEAGIGYFANLTYRN